MLLCNTLREDVFRENLISRIGPLTIFREDLISRIGNFTNFPNLVPRALVSFFGTKCPGYEVAIFRGNFISRIEFFLYQICGMPETRI